jgi:hypothetical protein
MENIKFIIKNYSIERLGIGNILKCLISALSVNDNTVIECDPLYVYGKYDTVLHPRFIFNKNIRDRYKYEKVYTCRLLILKSEENLQNDLPSEELSMNGLNNPAFHHLFSFTTRIDWNYDPMLLHNNVKQRIFNIIDKITFTDQVYDEVLKNYTYFNGNNILGISVRTWTALHEINIARSYSFEAYKSQMDTVITKHGPISHIIFSIDNIEFIGPYIEYFNRHSITYTVISKHDGINNIQYAVSKMLTLSSCHYVIGNRISTFTELIYWFGKCRPRIYTVF